jgi:hypothetical protein
MLLVSALATPGLSQEPDPTVAAAPVTPEVATPPAATPDSPTPASTLEVFLITVGAGRQVWERFGHNAIWVRDTVRGIDRAYNYGMFSSTTRVS